jgi:hypothetical protein
VVCRERFDPIGDARVKLQEADISLR